MRPKHAKHTAAAYYSIALGGLLLAVWIVSLLSDFVAEARSRPRAFALRAAAQCLTASLLIFSGLLILRSHKLALYSWFLSMGMFFYAILDEAGDFAENGDGPVIMMLSGLLASGLTLMIIVVNSSRPSL